MNNSQRNLDRELSLISFFETEEILLTCSENDRSESKMKKTGKSFTVQINQRKQLSNSQFRFENLNSNVFKINEDIKINILSSILVNYGMLHSFKFNVFDFESEKIPLGASFFHRIIIPNFKKDRIRFFDYFASLESIDSMKFRYALNGFSFILFNAPYLVFSHDDYLVIECLEKLEFKTFDQSVRCILAGLGFITGYAPMDFGYFFLYSDFNQTFEIFKFSSTFIGSYDSMYSLVSLNPYRFFPHTDIEFKMLGQEVIRDERIDELENNLTPITKEMFSKLCEQIVSNIDFSNAIYLILENNKNQLSLQGKGALFSVVLEMLSNMICSQNEEKVFFIKEKNLRSSLLNSLMSCGKDFFAANSIDGFTSSPIKKRIENINAPTNQDKLFSPFQILEITLSEREKEVIKHRNDFLHGNNFVTSLENKNELHKLHYIVLELNYLVSALILKYIGYSGRVLNWSYILLDYTEIEEVSDQKSYKIL